jgi:hypothetical protein
VQEQAAIFPCYRVWLFSWPREQFCRSGFGFHFIRQVFSLFSHSRKLCAQLIFAAVVFQVQAKPPALDFSLLHVILA